MNGHARLRKALREQCWVIIIKIRYAYTLKEFDDVVSELASTLDDVLVWWLHKFDVDHWSNYLFKGL